MSSIDILKELEYLSKQDYENWRFGKIPYLEKVCRVNLSKLTFVNKTIKKVSKELKLKASWTAYNKYGKGKKERLIFSKSKKQDIEDEYATHYIDINKIKEIKQTKKQK